MKKDSPPGESQAEEPGLALELQLWNGQPGQQAGEEGEEVKCPAERRKRAYLLALQSSSIRTHWSSIDLQFMVEASFYITNGSGADATFITRLQSEGGGNIKADCAAVLVLMPIPVDAPLAPLTPSLHESKFSKFVMIANVKYSFPGIVSGRTSFRQQEAST